MLHCSPKTTAQSLKPFVWCIMRNGHNFDVRYLQNYETVRCKTLLKGMRRMGEKCGFKSSLYSVHWQCWTGHEANLFSSQLTNLIYKVNKLQHKFLPSWLEGHWQEYSGCNLTVLHWQETVGEILLCQENRGWHWQEKSLQNLTMTRK